MLVFRMETSSLAPRQPVSTTEICTILDTGPHTALLRFPVDTVLYALMFSIVVTLKQ